MNNSNNSNQPNEAEILMNFLKKYKNNRMPKSWTHIMLSEPFGSYDIPSEKYKKFINLYTNTIIAGFQMFIAEKQLATRKFAIEFDFLNDNCKRAYNSNDIMSIIDVFNTLIKNNLDIDQSKIMAFVLEKKEPTKSMCGYRDGIHIVYPYVNVTIETHQMLCQLFSEEKTHYTKLLDKTRYQTCRMMYRSQKNTKSLPYFVTQVYDAKLNNISNTKLNDVSESNQKDNARKNLKYLIKTLNSDRKSIELDLTIEKVSDNHDKITINL